MSQVDKKLLNEILSIEKNKLHLPEIKNNSRDEKEVLDQIERRINEAIKDAN